MVLEIRIKQGSKTYMLSGIDNLEYICLQNSDINVKLKRMVYHFLKMQKRQVEISKYTNMYVLASDGGVDIPSLGDK